MNLSQKDIDELKEIHYKKTGDKLCNREAWDMGMNLLQFFKAVYRYPQHPQKKELDNLTD
jgi:hypothetical protein